MTNVRSITELFTFYGHMDDRYGTDKVTVHSYGPLYEELFAGKRNVVLNILDIGVKSGASSVALAEYFTNAQVDGVDTNMEYLFFQHPRVLYYEIDILSPLTIRRLEYKKYDLIIDDASHLPYGQIQTYSTYGGFLNNGAMYIIEDISERNVPLVYEKICEIALRFGHLVTLHDLRHVKGRYNDIMIVIRKP